MNNLVQFDNQMMHCPIVVVTALFAIALGLMLRGWNAFQNRFIGPAVMLFTSLVFPVLRLCADVVANVPHYFLSLPLNFILGFVIGGFAWMFHAQLLKRWMPSFFTATDDNPQPPSKTP